MRATTKRFLALSSALSIAAVSLVGCGTPSNPASAGPAQGARAATVSLHKKPSHEKPVTIYLTRHGQTMLNALERTQGWSDSPLTEKGTTVASKVGAGLKKKVGHMDAVYSADMVRHFETATLMAQGLGQKSTEVQRDKRLREVAFGGFEGGTGQEMMVAVMKELKVTSIEELFSKYTMLEITDVIVKVNPNPELPAEGCTVVAPRMQASLNDMAKTAQKKHQTKVLAVSSGLSISCLLDTLGAEIPDQGIANGAVNVLSYKNGKWTVESVNDTSYAK